MVDKTYIESSSCANGDHKACPIAACKCNCHETHTEPVDSGIARCPKCGSDKINYVFSKRGVSIKCMNEKCGFDTHYVHDVLGHRNRELEALPYLKSIAPDLNFIENTNYGWEYLLEPQVAEEEGRQGMIYDAKVFFGGYKLERLKIAICQNITFKHYLEANEQYLQGRQEVFDKLAKMDALFVWYFPQDLETRIALAYCKELAKNTKEVVDRFHNKQYSIPREARGTLITADEERIREILHRNLFKRVFEKRYVL
jgi:hypothetical protein